MLDAHPDIAIPYESHLYSKLYPVVRRHRPDLSDPRQRARLVSELLRAEPLTLWTPRPSAADTLAAITRDDFHGVVEGLMRAWTRKRGKSRWGEKTPPHTLCWRTILEGFPDLQVINLIRDGREVTLSHMTAPFGPKHAYHVARRWVQYLSTAEEAESALGAGAFLSVRYEDLVAQPEMELRRICLFMNADYNPAMLAFHRGDTAYPTDQRNEANLRRPLLAGNTEKWRRHMSARDLRIFEALAGDYLERYGYPRTLREPRLAAWEALSCRYLEHPPRRALAMLRNRRGYRFALQRLRLNTRISLGL
jgi:hypothetical protein